MSASKGIIKKMTSQDAFEVDEIVMARRVDILSGRATWEEGRVKGTELEDGGGWVLYDVCFKDGETQYGIMETDVLSREDFDWVENNKVEDLKGVVRSDMFDDDHDRQGYKTILTEDRFFVSILAAMRAYDDAVVKQNRDQVLYTYLNLPQEWNFNTRNGIPSRRSRSRRQLKGDLSVKGKLDKKKKGAVKQSSFKKRGVTDEKEMPENQGAGSDAEATKRLRTDVVFDYCMPFDVTVVSNSENSHSEIAVGSNTEQLCSKQAPVGHSELNKVMQLNCPLSNGTAKSHVSKDAITKRSPQEQKNAGVVKDVKQSLDEKILSRGGNSSISNPTPAAKEVPGVSKQSGVLSDGEGTTVSYTSEEKESTVIQQTPPNQSNRKRRATEACDSPEGIKSKQNHELLDESDGAQVDNLFPSHNGTASSILSKEERSAGAQHLPFNHSDVGTVKGSCLKFNGANRTSVHEEKTQIPLEMIEIDRQYFRPMKLYYKRSQERWSDFMTRLQKEWESFGFLSNDEQKRSWDEFQTLQQERWASFCVDEMALLKTNFLLMRKVILERMEVELSGHETKQLMKCILRFEERRQDYLEEFLRRTAEHVEYFKMEDREVQMEEHVEFLDAQQERARYHQCSESAMLDLHLQDFRAHFATYLTAPGV